jgi:hypothetical protein
VPAAKNTTTPFDATSEIEGIVKTIEKLALSVNLAGKQDATNAILEVGSEMLGEGGSTLSSEIRKGYYWQTLGDAIERIIDSLAPEEMSVLQEDGESAKEV